MATTPGMEVVELRPKRLASGLRFPESPRWWDGQLYFSDLYGNKVFRMSEDGLELVEIAPLEGLPSGLGQLPDGRRIVVQQEPRLLRVLTESGVDPEPFADLSEFTKYWLNDCVTASDGITYTGCLEYDLLTGEPPAPGKLLMTTAEGVTRVAAENLLFPNGVAVTADGGTLLIAQTQAGEITAFDRATDGSLSNRRAWVKLKDFTPDGICLDAEGALWVGSCFTYEFLRILEGGEVTHRIATPGRWALAPMLGGADRRTLFLLTSDTDFERIKRQEMSGYIDSVRVDVAAAGLP